MAISALSGALSQPQQLKETEAPPSAERSALMAKVKGANTKPEMVVRRLAHGLGFRYRLHVRGLPGSPDLVFPRLRKVIFVHGCFWHRHNGCSKTTTPKTRAEFWNAKFKRNVERDASTVEALVEKGWGVLIVWECQTRDLSALKAEIAAFLKGNLSGPTNTILER